MSRGGLQCVELRCQAAGELTLQDRRLLLAQSDVGQITMKGGGIAALQLMQQQRQVLLRLVDDVHQGSRPLGSAVAEAHDLDAIVPNPANGADAQKILENGATERVCDTRPY